ncbi:DUF4224 domain-containing protein [Pseudomonas sp. DSP3-2-2]|uniref:DUF4224 domain-containing protein n=1 Tax=unclassified Pseudomonas TaxID=196821 RepID=UPI003CEFC8FC
MLLDTSSEIANMDSSLTPFFLSPADIIDLTGQFKSVAQARWLRSKSIPFIIGGDGAPKISKEALIKMLGAGTGSVVSGPSTAGGDSSTKLHEDCANWDKVTEALMAELTGLTKRSLEGKRLAGTIPKDVWAMIDGRVMYSLRRYGAWLDDQWPEYIPPTVKSVRKPRKQPAGNHVYKLV